ncbi:methyltransferase domain-containing protein [Lachnospiraceae bacterium 48-21]|nr:class I SAM-dependent methyltransferase [Dorea sp.]
MISMKQLIKSDVKYSEDGNIIHFIFGDEDRPYWSKCLTEHLVTNKIDLNMSKRYEDQKDIMTKDEKHRRFIEFISAAEGVKVDLASGPSGYFSPILDKLTETDTFIVTDACLPVIKAHSGACGKSNFFVFDIDLDRGLPFTDNSISAFSGNFLTNVETLPNLMKEAYRCLKPGGRFACIEVFYEQGSKSFEHLNAQGSIHASFETFVDFCKNIGFQYIGSDVLITRQGKIAEGDLFPLDDNDYSSDRTIYLEKRVSK